MPNMCSESGCHRPVLVQRRSLCSLHYGRWQASRPQFTGLLVHRDRGTLSERFWAKVDKSGGPNACWPWMAARFPSGYGVFGRNAGGANRAHRVSYELTHGVTLPKGTPVMHSCDNPSCVNPAHLSRGTPSDNSRDMVQKGRSSRGERGSLARLTEADVGDIRTRATRGESGTALAERFGVGYTQIRNIVSRRQWQHVS